MNQGWWSNIFQLSRLISRVNQTPFQAIFWIILILFFPTNSYRSSNKNEIQRDIFEMYRACESCRIFVSYLFNAHNGISYCMEKDRRKIAGKWRGFFFFSFFRWKKKFTDREGRSFNENPSVFVTFHIVWNSLLLFGRKKSRRCGGGWIESEQMRIVSSKSRWENTGRGL